MAKRNYDQMHAQYARMEAYDQWTTPFREDDAITVDKDYVFQPKTRTFKAGKFIVKSLLRTLLPIANKILFDLKIEGKDNLKQVDNAIRVSNHVMLLDTMINFQVAFGHRHFMTGASFQLKKGFPSKFFRAGGFLPLASSIKAMSNLDKTISEIFNNGNSVVTFYAEQAMWEKYENSRPLKKGAFHYAVKNNVPVIMTVILFRQPSWIRRKLGVKKDCTVKVCPAIYPRADLSDKENIDYMQKATQEAYDRAVCEFYGYNYDLYDMRLTPLENKLVAEGLIDKNQTLESKPNDEALKQRVEKDLQERAKAQQPLFYEEDFCDDEEFYDYYDFDIYSDDGLELNEQTV
ncbi:MAG: 1-acyl-sn-glycerol-3-phosphate acyltransferase [Clostridia bacterium]|nr:1-acyl-sn-glycerol-3-phosphate acyltransferase [Clostridia bacterium]MDE7328927.1 1-acyl-sn-glycerol-3-phosphate acyltransferase [Clostridia bacterium]